VDLVLCPDGAALDLVAKGYAGVAAARRPAPENRRPRSCLVYRKTAGLVPRPWRDAPARTLLGDSLSLAGCGVVCPRGRGGADGGDWPEGLRCGPDPYDHAPVLHALRLGAADYAVVREIAVHRFLADGLLDPLVWGVHELTEPLPDVVLLVSRRWSTAGRVRLGEALLGLGRREGPGQDGERAAVEGLGRLGLAGFNLLLDGEFEELRRRYDHCWPQSGF
jgi:hypothetical protein